MWGVMYKIYCLFGIYAVGLLSQQGKYVDSLKCFDCRGSSSLANIDGACSDQGGMKTECSADANYCYKTEGIHIGTHGRILIGRSCLYELLMERQKLILKINDCAPIVEDGYTGIVCLCDTDLCNSAGQLSGLRPIVLGMISLVIIMTASMLGLIMN